MSNRPKFEELLPKELSQDDLRTFEVIVASNAIAGVMNTFSDIVIQHQIVMNFVCEHIGMMAGRDETKVDEIINGMVADLKFAAKDKIIRERELNKETVQ